MSDHAVKSDSAGKAAPPQPAAAAAAAGASSEAAKRGEHRDTTASLRPVQHAQCSVRVVLQLAGTGHP